MPGRPIHDIEIHRALQAVGLPATPANVAQARNIWDYAGGNLTDARFQQLLRQNIGGAGPTPTPTPAPAPRAVPPEVVGLDPGTGWEVTPSGEWVLHPGYGGAPTLAPPPAQPPIVGTGGQPANVINPALYNFEQQLALQTAADQAAFARAQLAASTQLSASQASAQAQLEAQRIANQGALERLRGQLAGSLSEALMQHDINRANLTLDVAQLGADPRSTVGFLEYLGQAGGGPTAISQNLAAGITPSPVWDYMPETQGPSAETQRWMDMLEGFVGTLGG